MLRLLNIFEHLLYVYPFKIPTEIYNRTMYSNPFIIWLLYNELYVYVALLIIIWTWEKKNSLDMEKSFATWNGMAHYTCFYLHITKDIFSNNSCNVTERKFSHGYAFPLSNNELYNGYRFAHCLWTLLFSLTPSFSKLMTLGRLFSFSWCLSCSVVAIWCLNGLWSDCTVFS